MLWKESITYLKKILILALACEKTGLVCIKSEENVNKPIIAPWPWTNSF